MSKHKKQEPKWAELPRINPDAGAVDVHADEIWACVPQGRAEEPIRIFRAYTPDLHAMAQWFRECGVKTVAMESTGVYWIPVYEVLEEYGFQIYVVNARHLKNVDGRKSDMCDVQWQQTLHSYGLLRASFIPEKVWRALRSYWRQRASLIEDRAAHIQHMQKALQQMNLHLTEVLSDITGGTGLQIIRAIVAGERDPQKLAAFRDYRCQKSSEEIAKALTGNYRDEHLFVLKQSLALYDFYTTQIAECDAEMERQYEKMPPPPDVDPGQLPPLGPNVKRNSHSKNAPGFDVRARLYRLTGVDLVAIMGLHENTVQTLVTETGTNMTSWPTAKHFASWLGVAPHNDISAGKVLRSKTLRNHNRAGQAFRLAAQSVMRSHCAFGAFYRRKAAQIGVEQAIVATAHKIARTYYTVLKKRVPYQEMGADEYERRYREREIAKLRRRAAHFGLKIVDPDLEVATAQSSF